MANVKPFRGIGYDLERVPGDLAAVTTPPYDQIHMAGVEAFHAKHEHSYIRLILARQTPQDDAEQNRYTRARRTLHEWLGQGILKVDERAGYYLYRQSFVVLGSEYTRTGIMAAVHYDDPDHGVILRHERTLPKHVDDRLNLLRATRTQFESIFLLYDDPDAVTRRQVTHVTDRPHDLQLVDDAGTEHVLWRIHDEATVDALTRFFADRKLLIADGHHRYQTTGLLEKETGNPEDGWVLATLYRVDDPGIVILPTHRVVKNVAGFDAKKLLPELEADFKLEPWHGDADAMTAQMRRRAGDVHVHTFGLYEPSIGCHLLTLRDRARLAAAIPEGHSVEWMELDVAILHRLILEQRLGIGMEAVAREGNLEYHRWPHDAVQAVKDGAQAAFFLNATRPTQVRDLATRGELMPQKSTDFYPKLLSGLVAFPLATSGIVLEPPRGAQTEDSAAAGVNPEGLTIRGSADSPTEGRGIPR